MAIVINFQTRKQSKPAAKVDILDFEDNKTGMVLIDGLVPIELAQTFLRDCERYNANR